MRQRALQLLSTLLSLRCIVTSSAARRPDTIFPFDQATGVMYTCDAFAAHYATEAPFDTELQDLDYTTVATGHGPVIRYNQDELIGRQLSFPVPHEDLKH